MGIIFQGMIISAIVICLLIIIDTILAVSVALYKKEFDWKKFLDFLMHTIGPYFLIWAGLSGVFVFSIYIGIWLGYSIGLGAVIPITGIISIVAAAISAKMIASIYNKFKQIGIDISDAREKENENK